MLLLLHNICRCFGCAATFTTLLILLPAGFLISYTLACYTVDVFALAHRQIYMCSFILLCFISYYLDARAFVCVSCGHPGCTHLPHAYMLTTVLLNFFAVFYLWQICVWFHTHFRTFIWTCAVVCVCMPCKDILRWCFTTWCCDNILWYNIIPNHTQYSRTHTLYTHIHTHMYTYKYIGMHVIPLINSYWIAGTVWCIAVLYTGALATTIHQLVFIASIIFSYMGFWLSARCASPRYVFY